MNDREELVKEAPMSLSESERHELDLLRKRVAQIAYPCSPVCDGYLREVALRNTQDPTIPDGYVLVPLEPTDAMVEASFEAHAKAQAVLADSREVYRAMIAASPTNQEKVNGND